MFCKVCGKELSDSAIFCGNCGTKIEREVVAENVEAVAEEVYPGLGVSPYCMTGGTDAKYYSKICDNCIRFAPIYINAQQYGSIHGLNENVNQGALPKAVDFYKTVIKKSKSFL